MYSYNVSQFAMWFDRIFASRVLTRHSRKIHHNKPASTHQRLLQFRTEPRYSRTKAARMACSVEIFNRWY